MAFAIQTSTLRAETTQSGQRLENEIALVFEALEIPVSRNEQEPEPYVVRNFPYKSVYGHNARIEFMLAINGKRFLIETKRQNASGSVDEKLPFVWLNALENQPEYDFILIMDGNGWKAGAREWVQAKAQDDDRFTVLGLEGFKIWLSLQLKN